MTDLSDRAQQYVEWHAESVSKLNYYVIGIILAALYFLMKFFTENSLYICGSLVLFVWTLGGVAFTCGLIWIYCLTEYYASRAKVTHLRHMLHTLKNELSRGSVHSELEESYLQRVPKNVLDIHGDIKAEEARAKRWWPTSYKAAPCVFILWNIYRFSSAAFIISLLALGGYYIYVT